jgi:hypothetical protein
MQVYNMNKLAKLWGGHQELLLGNKNLLQTIHPFCDANCWKCSCKKIEARTTWNDFNAIFEMGFWKKICSYEFFLYVYCVYVQIVWCFVGLCASW